LKLLAFRVYLSSILVHVGTVHVPRITYFIVVEISGFVVVTNQIIRLQTKIIQLASTHVTELLPGQVHPP